MVRWYAGYRCRGHIPTVAAKIRNMVMDADLGELVPLLRVERRPRGVGEFYLFLAIEGPDVGKFPPEALVLEKLEDLAFRIFQEPVETARREIESFTTGAATEIEEFFKRIPKLFSQRTAHHPLDDEAQDPFIGDPQQVETLSLANDRLLFWASAKGCGSWSQFMTACTALGCAEDDREAKRLQRRLRLLGHMESSSDGSWGVAPPTLVRIGHQAASDMLFLSGQRTKSLSDKSSVFADVSEDSQPDGSAPTRITVSGRADIEEVFDNAMHGAPTGWVRYVGDVSQQLADKLKRLDRWEGDLRQFPAVFKDLLPHYVVKRYEEGEFLESRFSGDGGLYELWPREEGEARTGKVTAYYSQEHGTWVRGDWYGLRFLSQVRTGGQYQYEYDAASGTLSVSQGWRWPEVYERALVLSSGQLPKISDRWLTYQWISESTLAVLHQKLGVAQ